LARQAESEGESESSQNQPNQMFLYNASAREHSIGYNNLASDSETEGNFSDTGSCFGRGTTMREDGGGGAGDDFAIDGISEHSSDLADSEPEDDKGVKVKEKPAKRKKKKNAAAEKEPATKKAKGEKGDAKPS